MITTVAMYLVTLIVLVAAAPQLAKVFVTLNPLDRYIPKYNQKYHQYLLPLLVVVALVVRLWKFGVIPVGFNQDGALAGVDALALANYGTDRLGMRLPVHFTAWGFAQMNVLLSYIMVPFIKLFGLNRFTARLPLLLISLVALWVVYQLSKNLFGKKAAMVVLAFCAINPWQIMQSRWALEANLLPHFFLFAFYCLILGLQQNRKYLYLAMVFFGLTMYTYGIAWYSVPLFVGSALGYLAVKHQISWKEFGWSSLCYLLVGWPILGVLAVNLFKLPTISLPFLTMPYFPDAVQVDNLLFFSRNFWLQLVQNAQSFLKIVIIQTPDFPWNTIPAFGHGYLFSMPLAAAGVFVLLHSFPKHEGDPGAGVIDKTAGYTAGRFLLFLWLGVAVVSGLVINDVNINRMNIIYYPFIMLTGIGICLVITRLKGCALLILLFYLIAFGGFVSQYFGAHAQLIGRDFYEGLGEALESVQEANADRIYITDCTQFEGGWWVSEALTMFHHRIDALYYQGKAELRLKSGKLALPYRERYKYVPMKTLTVNPAENAIYVIRNEETAYFDPTQFQIKKFVYYNTVIPLHSIKHK